ncbi:MAG: hypothetical protein AAB719_00345 [Patescibacteria group bacterium]
MNSKTDSRAKKMANLFMEYVKTPEGKKALEKSRRRTKRTHELLDEARNIDPAKLHAPFTI